MLSDVQILQLTPDLSIPIEPHITLVTPALRVVNASSGSITLAIPQTEDGRRFCKDVATAEMFLKVGTSTLWTVWFPGTTLTKSFVSIIRNFTEMKLSFAEDKQHFHGIPINTLTGRDVNLTLVVTGLWCSEQRFGMRCVVKIMKF